MTIKALVLCAGFGTRLGDLTHERPKPLLPLGDSAILAHTLKHLSRHGIRDVAINLHYRADMIVDAIGDGSQLGVRVHYEREAALLGTAGSVRNLASYFGDAERVLVVYGDIVFDEDLTAMLAAHDAHRAAATLLVHKRRGSNSRLTLDADRRIVQFVERPSDDTSTEEHWVNSGVQILAASLLAKLPQKVPADLPRDVYVPLLASERIFAHLLTGFRCAIDSPERYRVAQAAFAANQLRWS